MPCFSFATRRRRSPTRRVASAKNGRRMNDATVSGQLSTSMAAVAAMTVVTFCAIEVAVEVTTAWTPPMSFAMRDCTSPVRVRVKKARGRRWRCV